MKKLLFDVKHGEAFKCIGKLLPAWYGACYSYPTGIYTINRGHMYSLSRTGYCFASRAVIEACGLGEQEVEVYEAGAVLPLLELINNLPGVQNSKTGSDPEIFVVSGKNKTLLPAFKFLEPKNRGTKYEHEPYHDGFAAEYGTTPVTCHGYMIDYLRTGLRQIRTRARASDPTADLTLKNTFAITAEQMQEATDQQAALGCAASLNAYKETPAVPPDGRQLNVRSAGGHIHFGMFVSSDYAEPAVKALDIVLGIPAVAIFADYDSHVRRRYYGRAGEFRLPKHGLEYRTLSNAWLGAPEIAHLILNLGRAGLKVGRARLEGKLDISEDAVREIINTCDVDAARKYVLGHLTLYQSVLESEGHATDLKNKAFRMIVEKGVRELMPEYDNLDKNWHLSGSWDTHSNSMYATWNYLCQTKVQVTR